MFASPVCDLLSNGVSTILGTLIWKNHPLVFFVYLVFRIEEAVEEHSGYEFPSPWSLLRDNGHHDFHHSHNVGNFGTFEFWDWLTGTDEYYLKFLRKNNVPPRTHYKYFWAILFLYCLYCIYRIKFG